MTSSQTDTIYWHVKLTKHQYEFFKNLALKRGDTEHGKEARQVRRFLNEAIGDYKRRVERGFE